MECVINRARHAHDVELGAVHRSAIVNCDRIKEVCPEGSSRHTVVLLDGTRLILSRSRMERLRDWLF